MQSIESILSAPVAKAVETLFGSVIDPQSVTFQRTNPQFEGDITLVVFPYVKLAGKSPEQTARAIGEQLANSVAEVERFNVVKGFLNLVLTDDFWKAQFGEIARSEAFGTKKADANAPLVVVEYSSPNTNKPLHLGHIRNNLLGYSVAEILKADGNRVMKVNLVNDRGIHICKSMLAWQRWGNGETPESSGMKGDHLVGKYYVLYDKLYKEANISFVKGFLAIVQPLSEHGYYLDDFPFFRDFKLGKDITTAITNEEGLKQNHRQWFNDNFRYKLNRLQESVQSEFDNKVLKEASDFYDFKFANHPGKLAIDMLQKWEAGDPDVKALWTKMNSWVYEGFGETYKKLGVDFDKIYYESNTYLLGKEIIEKGLAEEVLEKRPDGAVIIDLTADGLDQKVLLRSDGTSVYMTQDLGTAVERHKEFKFEKHIYVVGNEQEYHFKVLRIALKKLGYAWADGLFHLSYGMVELPEGKMKSREGTVVDADDLIDAMVSDARELAEEKGMIDGMEPSERDALFEMVGLAALKYFILKVDPKKKMLFNPKESIDLTGNTGPFIQYTHARIRSIRKKSGAETLPAFDASVSMHAKEKELIKQLYGFPAAVSEAAAGYSPAVIANYSYELAKTFNQFYDVCPVLKEEDEKLRTFRLSLCDAVGRTIRTAMHLLGIEVPERM